MKSFILLKSFISVKKIIFIIIFFLTVSNVFSQLKSFNNIFPNLDAEARTKAFSENGYLAYSRNAASASLTGGSSSGIPAQITNNILIKKPGYCIESIRVLSCDPANFSMLDIYNGLGNIRALKGIPYYSESEKGLTPLFEDASRIKSATQTSNIPDPAPASVLPSHETIYIKLKDNNFGNTLYRCEITSMPGGLSYSLTNIKSMTYFLVTIIKAENFTAQLYIEPIREGILIYSIAGVDISDFAANRISVNSAFAKRLGVISTWACGEILKQVNK